MKKKKTPKMLSYSITHSKTVHLAFEDRLSASMTFVYVPQTTTSSEYWDVTVRSDYGTWSHGWSTKGMGNKTIYEFMAETPVDYFVHKFQYNIPKVFDVDGTLKNIKKSLRTELKEKRLSRKQYNTAMKELENLKHEDSEDGFLYAAAQEAVTLCHILNDELYFFVEHKIPDNIRFFFDTLFPKFFPLIKELANHY
jgi:hypothetical protein